jgi:peptidoglycan/xylan/chitin deacetylase (PgdA/CDA1 family)
VAGAAHSRARQARLRRPPAHRWLLALCLLVLASLLLVEGLADHHQGRSETSSGRADGAPLAGAGPLLLNRNGTLTAPPERGDRRVVLTFDDGPDPKWTPKIAALLARMRVPATFFVVGSEAARHPGIVRDLHHVGFEIGNHTFTHADVAAAQGWRRSAELDLTDAALAGSAGLRTHLFRPPYSSTPASVTRRQERALRAVAGRGYLIVLSDIDSRDWARPGVERIERAVLSGARRGGIVLLHDGGGDRSQTVDAVDRVIPVLKSRHWRFALPETGR